MSTSPEIVMRRAHFSKAFPGSRRRRLIEEEKEGSSNNSSAALQRSHSIATTTAKGHLNQEREKMQSMFVSKIV